MKKICTICGKFKNLCIHHIDGNHENDILENQLLVCSSCHHKKHSGELSPYRIHQKYMHSPEMQETINQIKNWELS